MSILLFRFPKKLRNSYLYNMKNRTAIVTGAYGAIGRAISHGLARARYRLVLVGRDEGRLRELQLELMDATPDEDVSYHALDLSVKNDIEAFARSWRGPLHLLINNAATAPPSRTETAEGIEMQFATNVLGYFWMTQYFYPFMKNLEDARIVNVASYWAGDLDLDDPEFRIRRYNNDTAYRQSKQANRMLTAAFARRLKEHGIAVLAAHPGDVRSKVSHDLGYGGWDTPEKGAETPLYCALDPELMHVTGQYFEHMKQTACPFAADQKAVESLYELCSSY